MDAKIAEQILDELASTFEALESQSAAILQFLKDKKIANEEQLAPYLERTAAASSVRWRALRVRMGRLFSLAEKSDEEKMAKKEAGKEPASGADGGKHSEQAPEPWNKELVNAGKQISSEKKDDKKEKREPRQEEPKPDSGTHGQPARKKDDRKTADNANEPSNKKTYQPSTGHRDKNAA